MFTRSVTVAIDRSVEEVFAYVSDARNRPAWDEGVDSEELTSPEPIGVGSTVRTRMRSIGRDLEYTWEIVEHEPPRSQRIESTSGPFPTTLAYHLGGDGERTSVEFSITGRPSGAMRLMEPLIARGIQRNLDAAFPRLKALLESRGDESTAPGGS